MKICAMCGKKITKYMIPLQIAANDNSVLDCCGRCSTLINIDESLRLKEITYGGSGQFKPSLNN